MNININPAYLNPLFFILWELMEDPKISTFLIYGGKSSSKSFTVAEITLLKLLQGYGTIAMRKEGSRVQHTLKNTYVSALEVLNLNDGVVKQKFDILCGEASIHLMGLDSEDKIKGVEAFHYLLFDELDQFQKSEFTQGQASLRGQQNQKVFGTWNPISELHWIKTDLIDKTGWIDIEHKLPSPDSWVKISKDGTTVLIKTDYRDNRWIVGDFNGDPEIGFRDERLIAFYESMKIKDPHFYKVNVLGEWGVIQNESPFFYNYNRNYHVGYTGPPDQRFPLRISFDFNVGSTYCIVYQFAPIKREKGGGFKVFKTLKGKDTKDLCKKIKLFFNVEYGLVWSGGRNIIITGDSTGKNKTAVAGNLDNYQIILKELVLPKSVLRDVSGVNQRHVYSRTIVNDFLVSIPVLIYDETNDDLIYDIETAYFDDETSNIKKDRKENPQDAGDCFRYAINECVPGGINDIEKYARMIDPNYYLEFTK